jgi:dihydrofolate reductase
MGRKTFESIGRPLPGRANIVVTGNTQWQAEGVEVAHSLEQAVQLGREEARRQGVDEVMVIGGAAVYSALLPQAERLYYTEVHAEVDGDAYLPSINWRQWREISRQRHSAPEYDYSFVVCERDMTQ